MKVFRPILLVFVAALGLLAQPKTDVPFVWTYGPNNTIIPVGGRSYIGSCAATPPTSGAYKSQCLGSDTALYTCSNAAGCTVSGDWGAGGNGGTQVFTATGASTFTPGPGVTRVWVQVWGGGGGGAGGNNAVAGGSGGSGGGYAEGWCTVTPGTGVTVTVGLGGTAGSANAVGGVGGNSSFGSCLTATGAPAMGTISTNAAGGIDNRLTAINALASNMLPALHIRPAIASTACSGFTFVTGASNIMAELDSSGGCGALPPSVDSSGFGAGHSYKAGGGGGSGSFNAATTRVGGPGGLSGLGGAGGTGDGSTNGTPNGTCTAGTQPGGGGGGGAANATLKSAGCAGGAGKVVVWW